MASANSPTDQAEPQNSVEPSQLPPNALRTASTTQRIGMKSLAFSSQPGPMVIGRRMPESSSTGIITMLMTGAITSSLLTVSANASDDAAQAPPISRVRAMPSTMPPNPA